MKNHRKDAHQHALRAAAAVTGRGRTLGVPALTGILLAHSLGCSTTPTTLEEVQPTSEVTAPSQDEALTSIEVTEADKAGALDCAVGDEGLVDWKCCQETEFEPSACQYCAASMDEGMLCLRCDQLAGEGFGEDYMACCADVRARFDDLRDQSVAGCSPWGPPAPVAYSGVKISDLLATA